MRILKLPNNIPIGTLIYRLKASTTHEKPVKFIIANGTDINLIIIKSVDFYQANVYLNKLLQKNKYNFAIYVTDGLEKTLINCEIMVYDVNQLMTSSFIHFQPLISVLESSNYNSTIGYIHVKERENSNLPVTFEIKESDYFGIRYIFGPKGTSKAEIYLKTLLDYERQNLFRLQIYALNAWTNETFDTRNIVMKELIITVINEQDTPPKFYQLPHLVQLTEQTAPGDVILTLFAKDGDNEQNRKINYYLRQDDELKNYFIVDANTGEVVIKSNLDKIRDVVGTENLFTLTFVAKEVDSELKYNLNNLDNLFKHSFKNDLDKFNSFNMNNRYFINENFYDDFDFSSDTLDSLNILTKNNTQNLNENNTNTNTKINVKTIINDNYLMKNNSFLKKINQNLIKKNNFSSNHSLNVKRAKKDLNLNKHQLRILKKKAVSSLKLENEINVGFIILQISNHPPEFSEFHCLNCTQLNTNENNLNFMILFGEIEENAKFNTLVKLNKSLLIYDIDHGLNGTFDVQLLDATHTFDILPKFGYRNQSFQIVLINTTYLDYELLGLNKYFNFKIIVTDRSPLKALRNELNCVIYVLDINDNTPQFTHDIFYFNLNEKENLNTVIGRINAFDLDTNNFGLVTYKKLIGKLANNFLLNNSTGELILISLDGIDREKFELLNLIVIVCDNYCMFNSNSNQTLIEIKILDFNDNKPEFLFKRYDFLLNSDLLSFSSVAQVIAHDLDKPLTPNSNITYEIISGNLQNKFKIDKQTGKIEIISQLKIEGIYNLPIINFELKSNENISENTKNHLFDYSWIEENFDNMHLNNLINLYSPIINLTIRAHDQGIPIQEDFVNVYIHSQNHINRTVVFLLNESESLIRKKKDDYERYLSEISTGGVYIRSIVESNQSNSNMNRTLVYCSITYPSQSIINIHKINWISSKLINGNLVNLPLYSTSNTWTWFTNESSNRVGRNNLNLYKNKVTNLRETNILIWVLLLIILIIILFLFSLLAVWCYFCLKKKNKISSDISPMNYNNHKIKQIFFNKEQLNKNYTNQKFCFDLNPKINNYSKKNNHSVKHQSASSYRYRQKEHCNQHKYNSLQRSSSYDNYHLNEFDANAFNEHLKIKSQVNGNNDVGFISNTDPSDKAGLFIANKSQKKEVDCLKQNQNHNLDDASTIVNKTWLEKQNNEEKINSNLSDAELIDNNDNKLYLQVFKRNKVKFIDTKNSLNKESDAECFSLIKNNLELNKITDNNKTRLVNDNHKKLFQSFSQIDNQLNPNENINSELNNKQHGSILKSTLIKLSNDKSISSLSDNDSDIESKTKLNAKQSSLSIIKPAQHTIPKLHLKNEDITQKKSVFTIAYNGVKTNRLNSADSTTIYI